MLDGENDRCRPLKRRRYFELIVTAPALCTGTPIFLRGRRIVGNRRCKSAYAGCRASGKAACRNCHSSFHCRRGLACDHGAGYFSWRKRTPLATDAGDAAPWPSSWAAVFWVTDAVIDAASLSSRREVGSFENSILISIGPFRTSWQSNPSKLRADGSSSTPASPHANYLKNLPNPEVGHHGGADPGSRSDRWRGSAPRRWSCASDRPQRCRRWPAPRSSSHTVPSTDDLLLHSPRQWSRRPYGGRGRCIPEAPPPSQRSRNQFPKPAAVNGLPYSVSRNVSAPVGLRAMTSASTGSMTPEPCSTTWVTKISCTRFDTPRWRLIDSRISGRTRRAEPRRASAHRLRGEAQQ
jgi:hypothetical protein